MLFGAFTYEAVRHGDVQACCEAVLVDHNFAADIKEKSRKSLDEKVLPIYTDAHTSSEHSPAASRGGSVPHYRISGERRHVQGC